MKTHILVLGLRCDNFDRFAAKTTSAAFVTTEILAITSKTVLKDPMPSAACGMTRCWRYLGRATLS